MLPQKCVTCKCVFWILLEANIFFKKLNFGFFSNFKHARVLVRFVIHCAPGRWTTKEYK